VAERCNENDLRISRIDDDASDMSGVREADVLPRRAGIGRFVDAVAVVGAAGVVGFTAADEHDVRITLSDGNRADRDDGLVVEDRLERDAAVYGLPQPARACGRIKDPGRRFDDRKVDVAPSLSRRPDLTKANGLVDVGRLGGGGNRCGRRGGGHDCDGDTAKDSC
jgi:hypothetical protein